MKKEIVVVCLLVLLLPSFSIGQEGKPSFFFNELNVSANRTVVENNNTSDRFGFGIGFYRSWKDSSRFNLLVGVSYDKTSQFKKYVYNGHFSTVSDVTYNLHSLSIPVLTRLNFGSSMKFFVESGLFLELNLGANKEGTFHSSIPGGENNTTIRKERINLSDFNGGYLLGFGSIIPLKNYAFVIKFGYQSALTFLEDYREIIFNRYTRISIGLRKK